jgi:hypothetical protein
METILGEIIMQTEISKIKDPVQRIFAFAQERYSIFLKKEAGKKPPWTNDEILQNYRFTNIYREDDRVTAWIRENWRRPHSKDPDLWFAMCVARLFNQPSTLKAIGYPVPFEALEFASTINRLDKAGAKIFNAAYIVSTNGLSVKKTAYIHHEVIVPLWKARERLRPQAGDSLNSWHMTLGQMQGFGSFMTAQVIADIKYHPPLNKANDWETFAASGPGSRRGLNYVLDRGRRDTWTEDEFRLELGRLREKLLPLFARHQMPKPHAQDVQNLLCEWSKYWRAVTEDKMPKQKYRITL